MNILNKVTLQVLKKNKVRTMVTIIGIILSAAMFTAVTTTVISMQEYMLDIARVQSGNWYGGLENLNQSQLESILSDSELEDYTTLRHVGYSKSIMDGSQDGSKPYLYIAAIKADAQKMFPVSLTEGRLPQNGSEIILPRQLRTRAGIATSLNDVVELDIGRREFEGRELFQCHLYIHSEAAGDGETASDETEDGRQEGDSETVIPGETFIKLGRHEYKVVGYFEQSPLEGHNAPGYMAFTLDDGTQEGLTDIFFTLKNINVNAFLQKYSEGAGAELVNVRINSNLLRYMGSGDALGSGLNSMLYSLAAILIAIIMFGSVALIYNAFSISLGERTKQFAILKSVGATKKQITHSVLYEGFVLSAIAVPVGVLAGLLGIGVTLRALSGSFARVIAGGAEVNLSLKVSAPAIIIAVLVCIITVMISAYLPAKRAVRQQPVEAIRQNMDVKIAPNSVKTNSLILKLFRFEGMLADKNFKRNKKRYRATVISLFVSIVLFISASSMCSYLTLSAGTVADRPGFDIRYYLTPNNDISIEKLAGQFSATQGVTELVYATRLYRSVALPVGAFSEESRSYYSEYEKQDLPARGMDLYNATLWFIEDGAYRAYLQENGLDVQTYMDTENPAGLMNDNVREYNSDEEKYHTFNALNGSSHNAYVFDYEGEGYSFIEDGGDYIETLEGLTEDELQENEAFSTLRIAGRCPSVMFIMNPYSSGAIDIMYPYSAFKAVMGIDERYPVEIYMKAEDHAATAERLAKVLENNFISTAQLYDYAESVETNRALIQVINVFSYGFIILISLIAAANVFNTISTNINLRRREFAMLRSVGMTRGGMGRMMNFECLLYGIKSLLFGLPVSAAVTFLIYKSMSSGLEAEFFIPWPSVAIAVGSVFLVVFSTMLFSMRKVNRQNTIDELRNENL